MYARGVRIVAAVVVVVLSACGNASPPNAADTPGAAAPPAAANAPAAPAVAGAEPPAAASTASSSSTHKRKRSGASAPLAHDGTKPKNGKPLNPKDNQGRTVFVRADDQCFVEVAPKEKPAPDAPIVRATEMVDCPPAADDAAWDHCTAQIVLDDSGTKCFCVSGAGNPRPMPNPTPCPASAKTK